MCDRGSIIFEQKIEHIVPYMLDSFLRQSRKNVWVSIIVYNRFRLHLQLTILYTYINHLLSADNAEHFLPIKKRSINIIKYSIVTTSGVNVK